MNPKLLVCAVASIATLSGCAVHSPPDWNNGPYAEFGFTYDAALSPIAPLSTDEARAVLALPSNYGAGVYTRHSGVVNYSETFTPAPGTLGMLMEVPAPVAAPSTLPTPPPM